MSSIFLEALISARAIVAEQGIEALDALIKEHETKSIETARVKMKAETR